MSTINREQLEALRELDPDSWEVEPTSADYARFDRYIRHHFGSEGFVTYYSDWDTTGKDV